MTKEIKFIDTCLKLLINGARFTVDVGDSETIKAADNVKEAVACLEQGDEQEANKKILGYLDAALGKDAGKTIFAPGTANIIQKIAITVAIMREINGHRQHILQTAYLGESIAGMVEKMMTAESPQPERQFGEAAQ